MHHLFQVKCSPIGYKHCFLVIRTVALDALCIICPFFMVPIFAAYRAEEHDPYH